jgi:ribose/xylose/arabinose/galactoside ABC-type transport system permease subunit
MNRPASLVASIFLSIIALAQLCRLLFGITVVVGGVEIPFWPSAIAAIILASLAGWLGKERSRIGK